MANEVREGAAYSEAPPEDLHIRPNNGQNAHDVLQRVQGRDHTVSQRHRLGAHQYPADCPPLKARWFYAVDSPKWKPSLPDQKSNKSKPLPTPKKFIPFMSKDSQSIEHAYRDLCNAEIEREQAGKSHPLGELLDEDVKVPVNEDYLFDVNINKRELGPAYWIGPVYEVRRGTWFFQEGSTIKPCEENLATQLEEGYLKVKPWRSTQDTQRSSQSFWTSTGREQDGTGVVSSITANEPRKYRLFGSYMNSIVTYQDSTTALLINDDFMSRVSTTVFQTLGGVPGTKLVRGFSETRKSAEAPDKIGSDQKSSNDTARTVSGTLTEETSNREASKLPEHSLPQEQTLEVTTEQRPFTTLERRVSSLTAANDSADLEEQARKQEEKEMEGLREADDEDRERDIDHLVLVTHGIGQRLGLRLESVNFIHDVNVLRKTMKRVYKASPDLQALNSTFSNKHKNCRVQVLPVCWRHLLEFPYKKLGQHRNELDLADADILEDDVYPALSDITLESVPAVRNLISDLAVDVLLYQSKHCEQISAIVKKECNRIVELYKKRNPSFKGTVSLCGHSLGSAILFDILCSQDRKPEKLGDLGQDPTAGAPSSFAFECEEFFCLGSPVALFEMLKGKTIAGRPSRKNGSAKGEITSRTQRQPAASSTESAISEHQLNVSIPKCGQLYNIFHPSDPVSYRMEPLISSAMSSLKPQPLPSVKRSIWTTSGQSLSLISNRVGQSVGSLWTNFTAGVASSLLNRSLGITTEESPPQQRSSTSFHSQPQPLVAPKTGSPGDRSPTLIDHDIETLYEGFQKAKLKREKTSVTSNDEGNPVSQESDRGLKKLKLEEEKVRLLNSNGRVDYSIQEGAFDISLIASLASHLSYWSDEDVNHFMLSQMLCRKRRPSEGV